MSRDLIIAIDGPAASGKTTVGKVLADQLNFVFFDTGNMYRAVTLAALMNQVPVEDEDAISTLAESIEIDLRPPSVQDGRSADILIDGKDITWGIRAPDVDANVSQVSAYPRVRSALVEQQRRIGMRGGVVMVGRDIGTVVLPEADLKVYLDASVEERANRRFLELVQRGEPASAEETLAAMRRRDQFDSTREHAPLRMAEDAIIVDSDNKSIETVLEEILQLVRSISTQSNG